MATQRQPVQCDDLLIDVTMLAHDNHPLITTFAGDVDEKSSSTSSSSAAFVRTEKLPRSQVNKLLSHPASLHCPLAAALMGVPIVVSPADLTSQECLFGAPLFSPSSAVDDDANTRATRFLSAPRTGFAPGTVCGDVYIIRADYERGGFRCDFEFVQLETLLIPLLKKYALFDVAERDEQGIPLLQCVANAVHHQQVQSSSDGKTSSSSVSDVLEVLKRDCPRPCAWCNGPNAGSCCSSCQSRWYCSAQCQRNDRQWHKADCQIIQNYFEAAKPPISSQQPDGLVQ